MRFGIESALLSAVATAKGADELGPNRRDITYPATMITMIARPTNVRLRATRARAGPEEVRQLGQTPMATGRCTPQEGQLTVGTRLPSTS